MEALQRRQESIARRIDALEKRLEQMACTHVVVTDSNNSNNKRFSSRREDNALISDPQGTISKLSKELTARWVQDFAFVRAPPDYYDRDLEYRRTVLQAPSVHHLCKSIVMENAKVEEGEPGVVKYWLVIVQYSSRFDVERLRTIVHRYHKGLLSRAKIKMRLVSEETSYKLSGFKKNAVTPVGMKTQLPIVLAKEIADLDPDEFWIGGGEIDLKIGMSVSDFTKAYDPMIVSLDQETD